MGHFGSFLKNFERKIGLGIEKIQLPATQAKNKRCYLPQAPFGGGNGESTERPSWSSFNCN